MLLILLSCILLIPEFLLPNILDENKNRLNGARYQINEIVVSKNCLYLFCFKAAKEQSDISK